MTEDRRLELATALGVALLVAWGAYVRARFLLSSPYPVGVDGYYYVEQVRTLLDERRLRYPALPGAFLFLAPFAAALGPTLGVKIGAALGVALAAWPAYLLGRRAAGGRTGGLVAAAVVATSGQSFYLPTEFVKQGLGLTLAAAALAAAAAAAATRRRLHVGLAVAFVLAAAATHKLAFVLALGGGAAALVAALPPRRALLALVAGAVLVAAAGLLLPRLVPGAADAGLAGGLFSGRLDLGLPVFHPPGRPGIRLGDEVVLAAGAAVLAAAVLLARLVTPLPGGRAVSACLFALVAVAAVPWLAVSNVEALGPRLRLSSFLGLAVLGGVAAQGASALVARLARGSSLAAPAVLGALLVTVVTSPRGSAEATVGVHPALLEGVRALRAHVPADARVVIPERHIVFMARHEAGVVTSLHPPPGVPVDRLYRLIPGAHITRPLADALASVRQSPGALALPVDLHPYGKNGLVLLAEPTWQEVLRRMPEADRKRWEAWPTR